MIYHHRISVFPMTRSTIMNMAEEEQEERGERGEGDVEEPENRENNLF